MFRHTLTASKLLHTPIRRFSTRLFSLHTTTTLKKTRFSSPNTTFFNNSNKVYNKVWTINNYNNKNKLLGMSVLQQARFFASLTEDDTFNRVVDVVKRMEKVDDSTKVDKDSSFLNDLGLDSLDQVELVMAVEDEFTIEIPDDDLEKFHSVQEVVNYVMVWI